MTAEKDATGRGQIAGPVDVSIQRFSHGEGLPLPAYETAHSAGMDLIAVAETLDQDVAAHSQGDVLRLPVVRRAEFDVDIAIISRQCHPEVFQHRDNATRLPDIADVFGRQLHLLRFDRHFGILSLCRVAVLLDGRIDWCDSIRGLRRTACQR